MPSAATAAVPLLSRVFPARIALLDFLRQELAPFPGRGLATVRVVIACVAVLVLCMTLHVPEAHLAVWVVTRFAMEEQSQTVLTAVVFLLALTVGIALPLVLLTFAMDQASLRFCLMAALAALGLFLRRTFVIGSLGFVVGLIGTMILTVPDFIPVPEQVVRSSLWLWSVFALGLAGAAAANLLISPKDPEILLRAQLLERLQATEAALARCLDMRGAEASAAALATAGITKLLALLKSAEVVHPSVKARHAQYSALITLVDRLVSGAAALELLSPAPLHGSERERLQRLAADCARLREAVEVRRPAERRVPSESEQTSVRAVSARLPALVELEHAVAQLEQALGPEAAAGESSSESEPARLFVPDAFTNPEYVRYALKGALAVMVCYVLMSAVAWPGIRTCIVTCLIVGLTSEGATIQKGTLRIAGAAVGAAMGFLAILVLIPNVESIAALALLVAAGTAVAAWVVVGSPRIAYAGVQIAFAFYVCVIQGFEPTWYFYTIRDRLAGILLGNAAITLVFHSVWPVRASSAMWTSFAAALRAMARLATVGSRSDDQTVVAREAQGLRLEAYRGFAAAQQSADEAAFEPSGFGDDGSGAAALAERERLQRATADAQSVFLTQLVVAQQRPNAALAELPSPLVEGLRRFDAVIAESLAAIADRAQHAVARPLPDIRIPLAAVTVLVEAESFFVTDAGTTAQLEARLALYRELVPRIERLGSAELPAAGAAAPAGTS